jgi:hypothetical protein
MVGGMLALGVSAAVAEPAVKLEPIPGSPAKRVMLTAKAAQRLGIETTQIGMQPIVRRQIVSGLVVPPVESAGELKQIATRATGNPWALAMARPQPAAAQPKSLDGEAWVLVTLSPAEWERLAKDKPARVLPLATRQGVAEVIARPSGMPPTEDAKRSMLSVHYVVKGAGHGLGANKRMRVELELAGGAEKQKVVPYGAVYYDAKGLPWVYVNPRPLVYERQRVSIERIAGDVAILSGGPEVGTTIVSVGAAMLYGTEVFGK